jgi:hypothetical protein
VPEAASTTTDDGWPRCPKPRAQPLMMGGPGASHLGTWGSTTDHSKSFAENKASLAHTIHQKGSAMGRKSKLQNRRGARFPAPIFGRTPPPYTPQGPFFGPSRIITHIVSMTCIFAPLTKQ